LSKYRSGKLPRSLQVIPLMEHWQELLELTNPQKWSAHAFYEVVRIFTSKTESERTLRFFSNYLLPRVLKDIKENKKLNYHLFRALQKGLYRPASWFRGILMPFFNTPDITIKHAQILAAVLMKTSVPNAHAAAVFYKCCDMPYSGPQNVIMKIMIEKKFGLPAIVIQRLVNWFCSFENQSSQVMPVLWYQTLHSFVKIYGRLLISPLYKWREDQTQKNCQRQSQTRTLLEGDYCQSGCHRQSQEWKWRVRNWELRLIK